MLEGDEKQTSTKLKVESTKKTGEEKVVAKKELAASSKELEAEKQVERKPKSRGLGDIVKKLTEDKDTAEKAEKMLEKAPKESKKIARKKPEAAE